MPTKMGELGLDFQTICANLSESTKESNMMDDFISDCEDGFEDEFDPIDDDPDMPPDPEDGLTDVEADAQTLAGAGWGTDEDYGYYGDGDY